MFEFFELRVGGGRAFGEWQIAVKNISDSLEYFLIFDKVLIQLKENEKKNALKHMQKNNFL